MMYRVGTLRDAGLEAKWGKTRTGAPAIFARDPSSKHDHQSKTWWLVDADMWKAMRKDGIKEGFDSCTIWGDVFHIPA